MPSSYTILPEAQFVYTRGWGVVTDADLQAHANALRADPRFRSSFAQLADFGDVTEVRVTTGGIRTMIQLNPFGKGARRAIVGSSTIAFGLARMYELMKPDDLDLLMVVHDVAAALKWLGNRLPAGWREIPTLKPDWTSGGEG